MEGRKEPFMKVLLKNLVIILLGAVACSSCASMTRNDFLKPLPKAVGIDEFAGKSLVSETGKYEFDGNGGVVYSVFNYGRNRYEKSVLYAYSCDSEAQILYMVRRGYYHNDVFYLNLDKYMEAAFASEYWEEYFAVQKKRYLLESKLVERYEYKIDGDRVSLSSKLSTRLDKDAMGFVYSPKSDDEVFLFSLIWYAGGVSSTSCEINDGMRGYRGCTEAYLVLFDITDSTARVAYVYNDEILGYGRMDYKIDLTGETQGRISVSFRDIDQGVIDFYDSRVKELKNSPAYPMYEQELKIGAFINSQPLVLESATPTEYDFVDGK